MSFAAWPEPSDVDHMVRRATAVLQGNDMGEWTRASPDLYPHQWSWDTGFIAIGLARLDTGRAARELLSLFEYQWTSGKVPHIVFNPKAPSHSYFPGAEHWSSAGTFPEAPPAPPYTSALCQPPIHAVAARRIREVSLGSGEDSDSTIGFLRDIYPKLLRWHRYLLTRRDTERSGLVTIYHPWESGTDNSPRWDAALEQVEVGEMPEYKRLDLQHIDDPAERPTGPEYDRFIWLVELVKRARCDEGALNDSHPFLVKDVLASSILVAANEALLEIADLIESPDTEREEISEWIDRGRKGLENCWDEEFGIYLDYDVRRDEPLRARTVAGFAPIVAGGLSQERLRRLIETLNSVWFAGHPRLRWPLPPSTSPSEKRFHPRSYWRGPVWPVINWLLWWSLGRAGESALAEEIKTNSLAQLAEDDFAEYFEPFSSESLGSLRQSWTAAVTLDWLADDH